ncbi:hypothetical protein SAMN05216496_0247 [Pseudomonas sp. Z003-0.4C(8344-21)]|uniref:hypothetical protein n=1 Tax=Pseudomonas sp. Z003-0.4C(8344-21) TaxID=1855380 RepID=UPI000879D876|nr:hypothetical protein [Pseudomonas sp. Z003-0.4C(8344-21)]SDR87057.1 hypothetical protein SAMN05216496_0247 [Pseudomonas sp. Z003-0.4C(8344-21)]
MSDIIPTGRLAAARSLFTTAKPQPVITVEHSRLPRRSRMVVQAQQLLMNYALGH